MRELISFVPGDIRGLTARLELQPRSFGNPLMRRQGGTRYPGLAKVPSHPMAFGAAQMSVEGDRNPISTLTGI